MFKKLTLFFVVSSSSLAVFAQAPVKGPLDKQKFTVEIIEEGKKKPLDPDDLNFAAGKFKSVVFGDWGFTKASKYETSIDSTSQQDVKVYAWHSNMTNEFSDTLKWTGTVKGEDIEGAIILINKKGVTKKNYTYTGKLKKKPGQK